MLSRLLEMPAQEVSRCRLRGSRVGKISNPGLPYLRRFCILRDVGQQILIEIDSKDGSPLSQLELPREVDLVGNPISAVGGPRHQGASRVALVPQSPNLVFIGFSHIQPHVGQCLKLREESRIPFLFWNAPNHLFCRATPPQSVD